VVVSIGVSDVLGLVCSGMSINTKTEQIDWSVYQ
jgi:hypothetical protein